jgi:hypothetical protein
MYKKTFLLIIILIIAVQFTNAQVGGPGTPGTPGNSFFSIPKTGDANTVLQPGTNIILSDNFDFPDKLVTSYNILSPEWTWEIKKLSELFPTDPLLSQDNNRVLYQSMIPYGEYHSILAKRPMGKLSY